ncbi:MAG: hypothetical protein OEV74_02565 [Cyclobacteriaceae bacterium]|nr:hypothetical protein [Cyclobacteriaceae bacterium]MDH4295137.1 hypothetical protein [Cyclobacteriaceae bacterium]MDH5249419.1 hypothetical protein [Cyclobacteriaceae bacterium]
MMVTEEKQITAVENGTFDLVQGDFSPNDALEIVTDLFSMKINFHEVKSFSQLIRFGAKDPDLLQRISELKIAQKQARELINEAKESGKSVRVNSTISIELIDSNASK